MSIPRDGDPRALLALLLQRGDRVAIVNGRLNIEPASGEAVPQPWLAKHGRGLTVEILRAVGQDAFFFLDFTTGNYGPRHAGGVTLQFETIYGGDAYCIFNARLDYERGASKGKRYPGKRFRVGKRSAFLKFWKCCGLDYRRLSEFHECMGRLSGIALQGSRRNERIYKDTLKPVEIPAAAIRRAFLPDNSPTTSRHDPDSDPTSIPDNESPESRASADSQANPTTGNLNHGNTVVRECGVRGLPVSPTKRPQEQSTGEWLDDYFNHDPITEAHR